MHGYPSQCRSYTLYYKPRPIQMLALQLLSTYPRSQASQLRSAGSLGTRLLSTSNASKSSLLRQLQYRWTSFHAYSYAGLSQRWPVPVHGSEIRAAGRQPQLTNVSYGTKECLAKFQIPGPASMSHNNFFCTASLHRLATPCLTLPGQYTHIGLTTRGQTKL